MARWTVQHRGEDVSGSLEGVECQKVVIFLGCQRLILDLRCAARAR